MIAGNCIEARGLQIVGLERHVEAPKSTVFALICAMPPPEPIDW